jgi:hypothetical protein
MVGQRSGMTRTFGILPAAVSGLCAKIGCKIFDRAPAQDSSQTPAAQDNGNREYR